jgi:hypothetical protein
MPPIDRCTVGENQDLALGGGNRLDVECRIAHGGSPSVNEWTRGMLVLAH